MDIVKKVTEKFGKIPTFITYKDLCHFLDLKYGKVTSIGDEIFDAGEILAKASPRKQFLILLHNDLNETAHRMINTLTRGIYGPPHKHTDPNTSEEFMAVRGAVCVFEFSEVGGIIGKFPIGEGYQSNLVEIKPGSIHSVLCLTETATCFEIKGQTKYDQTADKSFYPWSPKEGDPEVPGYLGELYSQLDPVRSPKS